MSYDECMYPLCREIFIHAWSETYVFFLKGWVNALKLYAVNSSAEDYRTAIHWNYKTINEVLIAHVERH